MTENNTAITEFPVQSRDVLSEILRTGAQKMLKQAIEAEVSCYIQQCCELRDKDGKRKVVRSGHHP